MSPTQQAMQRAASRVLRSSLGEIIGRAINLALPFLLLAAETVGESLDGFFISLAVAFFVQGNLGNAVTLGLVPELVASTKVRSLSRFAAISALAGLLAAVVLMMVNGGSLRMSFGIVQVGSVAVMAAVGLLAAPAVASLNADHLYFVPGLTWGLRLLPVALYFLFSSNSSDLVWLLAGLALTDGMRTGALLWLARHRLTLWDRAEPLRFPAAALYLILGFAIAGLNPLIARWMVSLGEAGGVSLFEAADRLYSAIGSLATIGLGNVILVYLARLSGTDQESQGWRWILIASSVWSLAWLCFSIGIWALFPSMFPFLQLQGQGAIDVIRDSFLALAAGVPGLILSSVLSRRLIALGQSRSLILMTVAGVVYVAASGAILQPLLGNVGIAISLSSSQYLIVALMMRRLNS